MSGFLLRLFACLPICWCASWSFSAASAGALLADGVVLNQAKMQYVDNATGLPSQLESNVVRTYTAVLAGALLLNDQSQRRSPGSSISMEHRLINTSNQTTTFNLQVANVSADDFELQNLKIFRDLNKNGEFNAGEPAIRSIELGPGQETTLVLGGDVPQDAQGTAKVLISAHRSGLELLSNTDTIMVSDGAVLAITLEASTVRPAAGELVDLTLTAQNIGNAKALGVNQEVDGRVESQLLVVQKIAANTRFAAASTEVGEVLYLVGNGYAFSRTPPADLGQVTAVAYAVDELDPTEDVKFKLKVVANNNSTGELPHVSEAWYDNSVADEQVRSVSNEVVLFLKPSPPQITYFADATFSNPTTSSRLGGPLYLQADAASCNKDATVSEQVIVSIRSSESGDQEEFVATEQGINTGIFRVEQAIQTVDMLANSVVKGNGRLESIKNDRLVTSIADCGVGEAVTSILIDPEGVVFDSRSNLPVANAIVQLIDVEGLGNGGNPGAPAIVFQDDGRTPAPSRLVTGADGSFRFPLVGASAYRLDVQPPSGFEFASRLAPGVLPPGRTIDLSGSYGGRFPVNTFTGAVKVDIPVDNVNATGLQLKKTVARNTAEIGDVLVYTLELRNISGARLFGIRLNDRLPTGFQYQAGSLRRDGQSAVDPEGGNTSRLIFNLGTLEDQETTVLTYALAIGIGSEVGSLAVNRAQASSAEPLAHVSNEATAAVRVEGGVFDPHGFVLGKVYADCNGDGLQQQGELGVPGIKVWLQNGNWSITDSNGMYSFYGLPPHTHVAKIDSSTLPAGVEMLALSNRHAGDGHSRFIDLKNGELHRSDFAINGCSAELAVEIQQRVERMRSHSSVKTPEIAALRLNKPPTRASRPASGSLGRVPASSQASARSPSVTSLAQDMPKPLGKVTEGLDNQLAFLAPLDRDVLGSLSSLVRIKGPLGARLSLTVNDQAVPDSQIGLRVESPERDLQAREYVGVNLQPGENILVIQELSSDGRVRARQAIRVMAPGDLATVEIQGLPGSDAEQNLTVRVLLRDAVGIPVRARTPLTLFTSAGKWQSADLDPSTPGQQVFVQGGSGDFVLLRNQQAHSATVRAESGLVKGEGVVAFSAHLRDMIAVGLLEGVINLKDLSKGLIGAGTGNDGFEKQIEHFSRASGSNSAGARAALFLKGKVKGDYLLTLAYDSDKPTQGTLFRDIEPDKYYPVYGDESIGGYDAQSSGRLYLRVDKNQSWFLIGDYNTQQLVSNTGRKLAAYNRSMNGIAHRYDAGVAVVESFASRETSRQVVEEIPANGTSGPYELRLDNLVGNSEKIEIVTRDRDQPALLVRTQTMQRFTDYTLEPFSGRILFRSPVASVDENLNPQFVRVSYEVQQDGEPYWVLGTQLKTQLNELVEVGGSWVEDQYPQDPGQLAGVYAKLKSSESEIVLELASSDRLSTGSGHAQRVEGQYKSGPWKGRFLVSRADPGFNNPSSTLGRGRSETRGKVTYTLNDSSRLFADLLASRDALTGRGGHGVLIGFERSFANHVKARVGLRSSSRNSKESHVQSLGVRVDGPLPILDSASVYGELEKALGSGRKSLLAIGGEYRLDGKGRIYGRHEFISSLAGPFGLDGSQRRNTSVLGIDAEYMQHGRAFSEYRAREGFTEREVEAAIGLKNRIPWSDALTLDTSLERIRALSCKSCNESVAGTGAVSYTPDSNTKLNLRLELRNSSTSRSVLSSQGFAKKLSRQWTVLARNIFLKNNSGVRQRVQDRLQLGMAYRDIHTNRWNALARYEFKTDRTSTGNDALKASDYKRNVHVFSIHGNRKISRSMVAMFRYASKFGRERFTAGQFRTRAQLVSARFTHDLNAKWDWGIQGAALFSNDTFGHRTALGIELGYLLDKNQWLSAGYNFVGFKDKDLAGQHAYSKGLYLRLRMKFDEHLFEQF